MKLSSFLPEDQVFWYINKHDIKPLTENITTDVVVIGGGMAGLTAAQSFQKKGLKVVLLEKNFCGSGASGKSSGFITPDSEFSLRSFMKLYEANEAKKLWDLVASGVDIIKNNITDYNLDCDYLAQDTLVVASTSRAFTSEIESEHNARLKLNYPSTLYTQQELPEILGTDSYKGAVRYGGTFGIHGYRYCLGMKQVLQDSGVQVYEETPVIDIQDHVVTTPHATVKAEHIIVCTDRFTAGLNTFADKIYHAQTCIMLSAPLSQTQIKNIFPQGPFLVWDTDLIYQYYRLTQDNRLMVGGGSLLYTYAPKAKHDNTHMIKKLTHYIAKKFPEASMQFEYIWPGLIGISKDLLPIAGHDNTMPSVYYVVATAGLPWAATLGAYSADRILNNNTSFDHYFSPYRSFKLGPIAQRFLGTRLTFALSNFLTVSSI